VIKFFRVSFHGLFAFKRQSYYSKRLLSTINNKIMLAQENEVVAQNGILLMLRWKIVCEQDYKGDQVPSLTSYDYVIVNPYIL
jgi:hypothetical protein